MPRISANFAIVSNELGSTWMTAAYRRRAFSGRTLTANWRRAVVVLSCFYLSTSFAQSDFSTAKYQSVIEQAENELGAYNYALVEPAVGLGINLQRNNQHAEAVDALERALHVNRVNKGLHHLDHVPIVDLLVSSHLKLGDWERAAQQQQLRFWIHKREIKGPELIIDSPALNRFVDASLHYAKWQSRSHRFETGQFPLHQLREAQRALSQARDLLVSHNRIEERRYLEVLNAGAVNNYNIVVYLGSNEVDPVTGSYAGDQDISDYLLRQNIMNENYHNGTAALREVVERTAGESANIQHAMAKLNYANWQLLFNRPQTAKKEYKKAFETFVESGLESQIVNQRLAEPARINAFTLEPVVPEETDDATQKPTNGQAYVEAVFDVTRSGEVRNVEIEQSWPNDNRQIRREARGRLAYSKFRPALINGEPVAKKDVKIRYVFPKTETK